MSIRCRLGFHQPCIEDKPGTVTLTVAEILADADTYAEAFADEVVRDLGPDGVAVFGGIRRYCSRCGVTLPSDEPQVGDWFDPSTC